MLVATLSKSKETSRVSFNNISFHSVESIQNIVISIYDTAVVQALSSHKRVAVVSDSVTLEVNVSWSH